MLVDRINQSARKIPAWSLYIVGVLPGLWLLWQAVNGGLGVDPVKALEHELGLLALQLLVAGLCITPLRRVAGVNLLKFRRAIGLLAFFYVVLHLLVWMVLDLQLLSRVWADILKRPYITVGMAALVLMLPLAITSNNWSVRRLGRRWRQLHKLTYVVVILGGVHFVMLRKGIQIEPLLYLAGIAALLAFRVGPGVSRIRVRLGRAG
ncbi:protein-methionine-sulfoxide reductase heme-binding subunit MsrQ [Thalassovita taeanensis]|uniref:Protein-methionine-sulfoxide reductase heme-binding subunit MsrQ n=1 Tax=Thalassovita taeanensis TaxID=657014 RepID=A0A1H9INF6_9RHOB|nr:protein-methionine-sulfoxide reductase heme-binding subunit MsrQ [Thalassovita taeanensis]SEQ76281.1 sulfoxide reductase heme-binding subunit YedZ [Thalassovita taeanensis]